MSDIAIVGIGCRFAGGIDSPESFWDFVVDKRDGVVDIPADRWDYRRYYDPEPRTPGRAYTKRGAFLTTDPWEFDPDFFGISPREATVLDPQQRLLLEVTWEALDDAGIAGGAAGAQVGVYVGGFVVDQSVIGVVGPALFHTDMHTPASASYTMLSNRIAYALNLVGPAITVDTACSSSLVAFHLACQALANDDCRVALAGGVNVMLQPETFVLMCKGGFLATDGRCKSFDAAADGYGRGEGAGMVALKRLDDAVADGDRIYAVVKATGSNQDGRTTAITVPNADSQEALARTVCARSGLAPSAITYLEAHGTGTLVGDPVELRALGRVFGAASGRIGSVGVGSVKATIGHTEAAAGVASVIKAALAISHRTLPPQGWLDTPNPDIPFADLGLHVQTAAEPLAADAGPMSVAVNGFGYGGTNAHAILAEFTGQQAPSAPHRHLGILPISARGTGAARALAGRFADLLTAGADPDHLAEAAWTRMAHHPFRTGVLLGDSTEDLIRDLRGYAAGEGRDAARTVVSAAAEPVFVFSGMGPQHWRMGRDLLGAGGVFAETAHRIDAEFRAVAGWSIIAELLRPEAESRIGRTEVAQPANFLIQVGLVAELAEYGITPAAVVGHSVGEVSAAYVSGMLTLRDAVRVAYHRARLQASTAGTGGMLAVGTPPDQAEALVAGDPHVDIAAVNSPAAVTLSGAVDRLDDLAERLTEDGVFARRLRVEVPYHSRLMDPIEDELRAVLADLTPRQPTVPLYSTVTGELVTEGDWDAEYWWSNVRQPVRFAAAVGRLLAAGSRVIVEVGPHPVLSGNIREALVDADVVGTTVPTLDREQADQDSLRRTLIGLHAAGVLDRAALFPADRPVTPHLPLPRYPWQRTRLHAALPLFEQARLGTPDGYAMLGDPDVEGRPEWLLQVGTELLPWLADHVVNGVKIMPGAAYLDAALSATASRLGVKQVALEQVRFVAPLIMGAPDVPLVALSIEEASGRFLLRSRSATGTAWTVHASGRTLTGGYEQTTVAVPEIEVGIDVDPELFYAGLAAAGLQYGPSFRRVTSVRVGADVVVATVDGGIAAGSGHLAHPAVVDAAMQCAAMLFADDRITEGVMVPVGVAAVRLLAELPETVTVVARRDVGARLRADVDLLDGDRRLIARLTGLQIGALKPGDDPLHRMADFYYADTMTELEPIDLAALTDAGPAATVVVELGDTETAVELAAAIPGAQVYVAHPEDPDLEAGLRTRLDAAAGTATRLHVCVVAGAVPDDLAALWALKRIAVAVAEFAEPPAEGETGPRSVFGTGAVHVTLVTRRAFTLPDSPSAPDPRHAALAGARRVLLNEQTPLRWRLIDTEPGTPIADLVTELAVPGAFSYDNCDEVLLRAGTRWAPVVTKPLPDRLAELDTAEPLTDPEANFALDVPRTRLLSQVGWRQCDRPAPGPGEVEVRMQVIGLNYKDPLKIIGLLGERELAPTYFGTVPGMEGVGTVVRVGDGVDDVAVGALVAVAAKGMMRRFAVVDRQLVVALPADTDPGHCTSTIAFGTAEYALLDLAKLQPGETVLIHGAAGGVGTAAIQVAKAQGARIIGTASTPERRAHILAAGADHAVNSRSLNFVDDVLALTGGAGAEVIVSSAPGEILRQNFHAAAEFGRIVEVGKADIYTGGLLELAVFDKNLAYYSMDLDRLVAVRPQRLARLLERVFEKVTEGTYTPLPYQLFGTEEVGKAFEETLRSSRPARIAVRVDTPEPAVRPQLPDVEIDSAATYLITGGFGGFGLAIGRWLTLRGARRLVLVGRRGATTDAARDQLAAWRTLGVEVIEELADIADDAAVAGVVARAHGAEHPLRGVFHAAGAVADNNIGKMTFDQLDLVYRPKVHGARLVHDAIRDAGITLDMFVLCSSGGSMYGIYGQYNYCAANLAVEALAEEWTRAGERALCVGWGHLSGATGGMAADETAEKYLDLVGFGPIDMADATAYLEQTLRLGAIRAAIIPTDWAKLTGTFPQLTRTGRTVALAKAAAKDTSELARLRAELAAMDDTKRGPYIARKMADELAVVMGVPVESIDMTIPVPELGLDSLMAVELGARVTKTLGIDLMSLQMGRSFSLEQAGPKVAELVLASEPAAAQPLPDPSHTEPDDPAAAVGEASMALAR
ncbi:type I polyketide synthase [Nocardia asteroides NBRC 15531]|uniref:Polyketide synthase n=2 Tax=Nocardia asteroides TaxID=1824 RepID=U5E5T0_NOCAS|nr:type I polyketide synthase [Nocardia asteroides]TLF66560.1 type I polyketide synthase [Nocardia asteroides NBRC 15531]UGT46341.1 type I polyketide synthase [Nocardia asteroides]SFM94578.1 Acyl transferase domain-containing protein [Nocardia asteroides]VEG34851.1 Beta-ketoacyl-acyl-carrier-protein synthase I [Nocardia asteroides]BAO99061.1 polyketide synthase [Nocardia asteroides]